MNKAISLDNANDLINTHVVLGFSIQCRFEKYITRPCFHYRSWKKIKSKVGKILKIAVVCQSVGSKNVKEHNLAIKFFCKTLEINWTQILQLLFTENRKS